MPLPYGIRCCERIIPNPTETRHTKGAECPSRSSQLFAKRTNRSVRSQLAPFPGHPPTCMRKESYRHRVYTSTIHNSTDCQIAKKNSIRHLGGSYADHLTQIEFELFVTCDETSNRKRLLRKSRAKCGPTTAANCPRKREGARPWLDTMLAWRGLDHPQGLPIISSLIRT
jgi:hypothetical protein